MVAKEFDSTTKLSISADSQNSRAAKVSYFYDPDIGSYYYGPGHPMKPQRMRMTHSLILAYDLYKDMEVYRPHEAEHIELTSFHDSEYVNFLSEVNVDNAKNYLSQQRRFNVGETTDCPIFDGLFEFQSSCAGASIDAAASLNHKNSDIAINWSGGLHHAKRAEAAGFCYVNDIVLCILELLKYHTRVMYIDIDVHHGDGVEEAFYLSHRVMTLSFHKFGDFFPGTGDVVDVGAGGGKYYAVNVPLNDGVDDEQFVRLYKSITTKCVEVFRPEAIVLQCGADSITGDRLGTFNLSTKGGGGYTIKNVARAWLFETAVALDATEWVNDTVPVNEYYDYFAPDFNLHLLPDPQAPNKNSNLFVSQLETKILTHLSHLTHAPSVQFSHVPADFFNESMASNDDDEIDQFAVEWEGGGLGTDIVTVWDTLLPTRLRRKDYKNDFPGGDDRDQVKTKPAMSILSSLRDVDE